MCFPSYPPLVTFFKSLPWLFYLSLIILMQFLNMVELVTAPNMHTIFDAVYLATNHQSIVNYFGVYSIRNVTCDPKLRMCGFRLDRWSIQIMSPAQSLDRKYNGYLDNYKVRENRRATQYYAFNLNSYLVFFVVSSQARRNTFPIT